MICCTVYRISIHFYQIKCNENNREFYVGIVYELALFAFKLLTARWH